MFRYNIYLLFLLLAAKRINGSPMCAPYPPVGLTITQVTQPVLHGEGPAWDERNNRLYFVDMFSGKVYNYNPDNGVTHSIAFNGRVSIVVPHKKSTKQFYVTVDKSIMKVTWDGYSHIANVDNLTTLSNHSLGGEFDDGKADKQGRLWIGTMAYQTLDTLETIKPSSLYLFRKGRLGEPVTVISPVGISNGLAWNKANNKFFYIDSASYSIVQYDYDDPSGALSNRKVLINFEHLIGETSSADGMTIDANDNLWAALIGAGTIVNVNTTDGTIIRNLTMPCKYVTSCIWGGSNLDVLFVTTSKLYMSTLERMQHPAAGSLFAVSGLGTHGLPMFKADV